MNIIVQNRRECEFDLADLEVLIKDYIEINGAIVSCYLVLTTFVVVSHRGEATIVDLDPQEEVLGL